MLAAKFNKIFLILDLVLILAFIPVLLNAGAVEGKTSKAVFAVE